MVKMGRLMENWEIFMAVALDYEGEFPGLRLVGGVPAGPGAALGKIIAPPSSRRC